MDSAHAAATTNGATPMTQTKQYQVVLTARQLATIRVALASEAEHARDAARDAFDDPQEEARHAAIVERDETLWRQSVEVELDS